MQSKATTVDQYLSELPADRRAALQAVRAVILKNLDKKGYAEGMSYGMIGYHVPHSVYPAGYHCDPRQPLPFAGLASQKQHMSLYLMASYGDAGEGAWLREAWAKTGKKLDMGKACIRFKKLEDLPLEVIGEAIRRVPAKAYIARCEAQVPASQRNKTTGARAAKAAAKAAGEPAAKKVAKAAAKAAATGKPAAKEAAKAAATATSKPAAKAAAKATGEPAAKKVARVAAKTAVKKTAAKKTAAKKAARRG